LNAYENANYFIIGITYSLRLDVSRRTTCGPTLQTMTLIVDG